MEAFGAGTAAIVSPIESITYKGTEIKVCIDERKKKRREGKEKIKERKESDNGISGTSERGNRIRTAHQTSLGHYPFRTVW